MYQCLRKEMEMQAQIVQDTVVGFVILPNSHQSLRYVTLVLKEDITEQIYKHDKATNIFTKEQLLEVFPQTEKPMLKFEVEIPSTATTTLKTSLFEVEMLLTVEADFRGTILRNSIQLTYFSDKNSYNTFVSEKSKESNEMVDLAVSSRRSGETIPFEASIVNMSKFKLTRAEIRLMKEISNSEHCQCIELLREPVDSVGVGKSLYFEGIVDIQQNSLRDERSFQYEKCSIKYFVELSGKYGIMQTKRVKCQVEVIL